MNANLFGMYRNLPRLSLLNNLYQVHKTEPSLIPLFGQNCTSFKVSISSQKMTNPQKETEPQGKKKEKREKI